MLESIIKNIAKSYFLLRCYKQKLPVNPFSILKNLKESQFWSREKLKKYQLKKLNSLINDARMNTIYYREKINGNSIEYKNLDRFIHAFPKLYRHDLLDNIDLLKNKGLKHKLKHSTSGSSGQPLRVEISGLAEAYRLAGKMRFYNWWGVDFHDRSVLIWKVNDCTKEEILYSNKIKTGLKNRLDLSVFELNDQTIFEYVKQINAFCPRYIRGYKSGLYEMARLMEKHHLRFIDDSLKVAIVTSEVLLLDERAFIESIFNCKVANEYGSAESGFYAAECPHGSMHINEELSFLYTDADNNAHVTELNNNGTPLINYQNQDKLLISEEYCSCGRTSRLINKIEGRLGDFVLCSDGTKKNALMLSIIIRESMSASNAGSIKQFRVTQNKNHLLIEIIPGSNFNNHVKSEINRRIMEEYGSDMEIEIRTKDQIMREKSGKLRYFIRKE